MTSQEPPSQPGSGSPAPPDDSTGIVAGLQAALTAHYALARALAVCGPRLGRADQARTRATATQVQNTIAATTALVLEIGGRPVDPAAAYPDAYPGAGPTAPAHTLLAAEQACARTWYLLYAVLSSCGTSQPATSTSVRLRCRELAQQGLLDGAVRAVHWRAQLRPDAPSDPFPGR